MAYWAIADFRWVGVSILLRKTAGFTSESELGNVDREVMFRRSLYTRSASVNWNSGRSEAARTLSVS